MPMTISFPGGVAVEATFRGHTVRTDQPTAAGGGDTAASPFDLFLASIGTCMGFYALRFCQERAIATDGLALALSFDREPDGKRLARVRAALTLPAGFPEKYHAALLRAVDQCAVKKQLVDPPQFELELAGLTPRELVLPRTGN